MRTDHRRWRLLTSPTNRCREYLGRYRRTEIRGRRLPGPRQLRERWRPLRRPQNVHERNPGGRHQTKAAQHDRQQPAQKQQEHETTGPSQPNYIAVWLPGIGTLWVDDLSLREVVPPAMGLSLDQAAYDAEDRMGAVTVTLAKRMLPQQVRFTISGGGRSILALTAPFTAGVAPASAEGITVIVPASLASCRFLFSPRALAPGDYEAEAELMDASGIAMATRVCRFKRVDSPL